MSLPKKLLASAVVLFALTAAPAYAEFNVDVNIGTPAVVEAPAVYAPPPVIVTPSPAYVVAPWGETYDPHHRRHDWRYWHEHHHDHDHDHWDHDHR